MSRKKSFLRRICDAMFVKKCVSCRKRIVGELPLCSDCFKRYKEEKETECGICGKPLYRCHCVNDYMKQQKITCAAKLFYYFPDNEEHVGNVLLYRLKRSRLFSLFDFLGSEFADALADSDFMDGDVVITNVPRTRKQKRRYGFDQAEAVARSLAACTGLTYQKLLRRKANATVQKKMQGIGERKKNAEGSFLPKDKRISLRGKRVLLFDDIVTTGASVAACARVLRRMGASEIVVLALAVSLPRKNLKYEHIKNTRLDRFMSKNTDRIE